MSVCQLCLFTSEDATYGECAQHPDAAMAQGTRPSFRFAFQPWTLLEVECEWRETDDAFEAYDIGGQEIVARSRWEAPTPIPEDFSVLDDSPETRETYFWLWGVRRNLWRDLITRGNLHQLANTVANQRRCLIIADVCQNLYEVVIRSLAYGG